MSGPLQPIVTDYDRQLQEYQLKIAAWLGIDPTEVTAMGETERRATVDTPPELTVTWKSYGQEHPPEIRAGRSLMPIAMSVFGDEPPVFRNGVVLDWQELARLRAEVGKPPEFPAPAGGWPAGWQR